MIAGQVISFFQIQTPGSITKIMELGDLPRKE